MRGECIYRMNSEDLQGKFELTCCKCGSKKVFIYNSSYDGDITISCEECENEHEG